jgi:hypothetical protein
MNRLKIIFVQKNKLYKPLLLLTVCFFYLLYSNAQAGNSCSPATVSISTTSQFTNGNSVVATNQLAINGGGPASRSAKTYVSVNGDFINGSNSIAASYMSIKSTAQTSFDTYNFYQVNSLSTATQLVFSGADNPCNTTNVTFTYTLAGGYQLWVPDGTYSTTITFITYFWDGSGNPIHGPAATGTASATLSISISNSAFTSITLSGSAGTASLNFNSASVYANGASLTQSAALTAFSFTGYHITVQASQNLKYGSNTIPISNVIIDATPSTGGSGITTPATTLSTSAQTFITSTSGSFFQNFDLLYYTTAGNTAFLSMPAGTYTTTLTFTISSP